MTLFANSIIVEKEAPNVPKYVMVRVRLGFGYCRTISGALYDINTKEITVDTTNNWQDNIFKFMQDNSLAPNLSLKGPAIDALIAAGNEQYEYIMVTGTYLR